MCNIDRCKRSVIKKRQKMRAGVEDILKLSFSTSFLFVCCQEKETASEQTACGASSYDSVLVNEVNKADEG